jgi:hypothetical protein
MRVWVWGVSARSGAGKARLKGRILRHVDCGDHVCQKGCSLSVRREWWTRHTSAEPAFGGVAPNPGATYDTGYLGYHVADLKMVFGCNHTNGIKYAVV